MSANTVEQSICKIDQETDTAQKDAQKKQNIHECITSQSHVLNAEQYIRLAAVNLSSANIAVKNVSIIGKKSLGKMDVYNFEAKNTHNYILANGAVVHNCDLISQLLMMETFTPPAVFDEEEIDSKPMKRHTGMWKNHTYGKEEEDNGAYATYM